MRAFVDASILVAAALGPRGASRVILGLAKEHAIVVIITKNGVEEALSSMRRKYGTQSLHSLHLLLKEIRSSIYPTPSQAEQRAVQDLIDDPRDYHILAGAIKYKAKSLITFDRRHFFTKTLEEADLGFVIELPGQFLERYRGEEKQSSKLLND